MVRVQRRGKITIDINAKAVAMETVYVSGFSDIQIFKKKK